MHIAFISPKQKSEAVTSDETQSRPFMEMHSTQLEMKRNMSVPADDAPGNKFSSFTPYTARGRVREGVVGDNLNPSPSAVSTLLCQNTSSLITAFFY